MLFPGALPTLSTLTSPAVIASAEGCLRVDVSTSIHEPTRTLGGVSLFAKLSQHSEAALIMHQQDEAPTSEVYEMNVPAGEYTVSLIAKGNMHTELAIDNVRLVPEACEQPRKLNKNSDGIIQV